MNKSGYAKSSLLFKGLALRRNGGILRDGVSLGRVAASQRLEDQVLHEVQHDVAPQPHDERAVHLLEPLLDEADQVPKEFYKSQIVSVDLLLDTLCRRGLRSTDLIKPKASSMGAVEYE